MNPNRTMFSALILPVVVPIVSLLLLSGNIALANTPSPKETYLKYRDALASANKVEDLTSYMCKKVIDDINHTPTDMKPMMFGLMKETAPKQVKVLSEEIKGDNATLALTSTGDTVSKNSSETSKGSVTFVKENDEWKINKESWNIKIETK